MLTNRETIRGVFDTADKDTAGNLVFSLGGAAVTQPPLDESDLAEEPIDHYVFALQNTRAFYEFDRETRSDRTLSEIGIAQRLDPRREQITKFLAGHWSNVVQYEAQFDQREQQLLKVPQLHSQNTAEAITDWELRDWWRSLGVDERANVMREMHGGPEHDRIAIAMLRSPYRQLDIEVASIRHSWDQAARAKNPSETAAIERGRKLASWAKRGLAQVVGISQSVIRYSTQETLRVLASDPKLSSGAAAWGLGEGDVRLAQRALETERKYGT